MKAGQLVIIKIQRPGFRLTVSGLTAAAGRAGDVIRVKNVDSQRFIQCTVKEDGTVEPIL